MSNFKAWWHNLAPREQRIFAAGAIAVLIMLTYLMIWAPLNSNVHHQRQQLQGQQADLQWMQNAAQQVQALRSSNPNRRADTRSLLAIVDSALSEANLKNAMQRMEPDGENSVKLWLNQGAFDSLIRMLGTLQENNGILVKSVNISPGQVPGLVDARITLANQI